MTIELYVWGVLAGSLAGLFLLQVFVYLLSYLEEKENDEDYR